jgi:hypothetical protein
MASVCKQRAGHGQTQNLASANGLLENCGKNLSPLANVNN